MLFSNICYSADSYLNIIQQKMKQYGDAKTFEESEAIGKEFQTYLDSLNAEQLLAAAREYSLGVTQTIERDYWCEALGGLTFFMYEYPKKTNNLSDISVLLNDLKDKSQSEYWRFCIMQFLREWGHDKHEISVEQKIDSAKAMKNIYMESTESKHLRAKAARESAITLLDAHRSNVYNDPNFKKVYEPDGNPRIVLRKAEQGDINLADSTLRKDKEISSQIYDLIQSQLKIFNYSDVPTELRVSIIVNLTELRCFDDSGVIKSTLKTAVENYNRYDEKLWFQLVQTNVLYFDNEKAASVLPEMLEKVKDRFEKASLKSFKSEVDKNTLDIKVSKPARPLKQPEIQ